MTKRSRRGELGRGGAFPPLRPRCADQSTPKEEGCSQLLGVGAVDDVQVLSQEGPVKGACLRASGLCGRREPLCEPLSSTSASE